jgi:hypothetical protein
MTQVDVEAQGVDHARAIQIAKYPAGYVKAISAWPIREHRPVKEIGRIAVGLDSGFGALVV